MNQSSLLPIIAHQLEITSTDENAHLQKAIIDRINDMIQHDFNSLVSLLYRMDVAERKLNKLLELQQEKDAAELIFQLMIEREVEKAESRKQFRQNDDEIPEEEKW